MRKIAVIAGLSCLVAAGCASDPRKAHAHNVLASLGTATSLTGQLKTAFTDLAKKDKVDLKEDDLVKTINETIKKLKDEGKALGEHYRKIAQDTEKRTLSKEDLEKYRTEFGGRLEGTLKDLDRETKEMLAALNQLDAKHAKAAVEIRRNLRDANTEFQQIVGGRS